MNQVLQVPEERETSEILLADGWEAPQITFRLVHAEPKEHPPRRPVEAVLR